ncbi:transcriptional regulator [Mycolicibacterium agri]|uniref:Transcriptional regulator n=1 Tax=Mycolicibacterium agri TaxID=36811 RepID=A0A2A7MWJ1_MYCAG|nr:LCP family protein [Mycolicibacterium agri]PEG35909.1 transcriptional regulator [Mycolicibacterium agri]GFG54253.1 transcriptional regulator [Mycolicibacterium agri]
MSDGDNATPRRPRASDVNDANQWLTRSPRPPRAAAPWERGAAAEPPANDPDKPEEQDTPPPTGNHTAGVTVADLIAKITGSTPTDLPGRHATAEPESSEQPEPPEAPEPSEPRRPAPAPEQPRPAPSPRQQKPPRQPRLLRPPKPQSDDDAPRVPYMADPDTEVIPAVSYADELPDLEELRQARDERVGPQRVGEPSDEPVEAPKKRKSTRRAVMAGRSLAAALAVLALVMTGGAWQWQSAKNNMLNRVSALDPDSRDIVDPNAQYGDENFLIVGIDSRFGENAEMGAGDTEDAGGARSDTVMLVNIPANRERVVAVSFPRDLAIEPMKCEAWNPETGEYGPLYDEQSGTYGPDEVYTETKLNSAFAFGGPKCLVKVIQKLSGLSINRFMAVDFAGFSKMVDALGGVEVCSTTPLEDYELGTVLPNAGRQIVDGHTALNYVRARQVTTETNGDYGRIKRQQLFLSSLLRSLISKEVFFSLNKLNNVVNQFINDSYVDNIGTKDLVQLGQSLQNVNAGRITFLTVPTTGYMDEWGNEHLREEDTRAIFDAIINDDPLPEEKNPDDTPVPGTPESMASQTPESPTSEAPAAPESAQPEESSEIVDAVTTDPALVTVQVSNSTGQDGLASAAASELQQHGFNVETPDDYPGPLEQTTVFFSPGNEQAAATVASAFPEPTIERVNGKGDTVQVVLGSDFSSVGAPKPSGSPVQVEVMHGSHSSPTQLPEDLTVTNAADTSCG